MNCDWCGICKICLGIETFCSHIRNLWLKRYPDLSKRYDLTVYPAFRTDTQKMDIVFQFSKQTTGELAANTCIPYDLVKDRDPVELIKDLKRMTLRRGAMQPMF